MLQALHEGQAVREHLHSGEEEMPSATGVRMLSTFLSHSSTPKNSRSATLAVALIASVASVYCSAFAQSVSLTVGDLRGAVPGLSMTPSKNTPGAWTMDTFRAPDLTLSQSGFQLVMYWNGVDDERWPFTRILDALLNKTCGGVRPGWTEAARTHLYATASLEPERDLGGNGGISFKKSTMVPAGACQVAFVAQGARWHTLTARVTFRHSPARAGVFQYRWTDPPPAAEITVSDLQHALIWTKHYGAMVDGDYGGFTRRAAKSWLASRGYPASDFLSVDQQRQLVAEGLTQRDAYGWARLTDDAVGFSVGIPTSLVTSAPPTREEGGVLWYRSSGGITHRVSVDAVSCVGSSDFMSALMAKLGNVNYHAHKDDWFVISGSTETHQFYIRAVCRPTGTVTAVMGMPFAQLDAHGFLFVAMTNSLVVQPTLNPGASPAPRLDFPTPRSTSVATLPPQSIAPIVGSKGTPAALSSGIDRTGKTSSIRLALTDGTELRAREVFERVSEAVFVVRTPNIQGSAVAVSERELVTNCHVLGDQASALLEQEGRRLSAKLTSANTEADRCVLTTDVPLPKWVRVRPFADIKVGEVAFSVGAPQGFELSIADGIVSSKRTMDGDRLIQTSTPISPGSSGGGLFDAQGHLLGVTTKIRKNSQNLNFAIAAEEYAK